VAGIALDFEGTEQSFGIGEQIWVSTGLEPVTFSTTHLALG
jgi:hypothetical protein